MFSRFFFRLPSPDEKAVFVTRSEFDNALNDAMVHLQSLLTAIQQQSDVALDAVELIGGSARVPIVQVSSADWHRRSFASV